MRRTSLRACPDLFQLGRDVLRIQPLSPLQEQYIKEETASKRMPADSRKLGSDHVHTHHVGALACSQPVESEPEHSGGCLRFNLQRPVAGPRDLRHEVRAQAYTQPKISHIVQVQQHSHVHIHRATLLTTSWVAPQAWHMHVVWPSVAIGLAL